MEPHDTIVVGRVRVQIAEPQGWEHVDNGGNHEFRRGDMRMKLADQGIATPESLASAIIAEREALRLPASGDVVTRLTWRRDPVLMARGDQEREDFWHYWNAVTFDPVRDATEERSAAVDSLIERAQALRSLSAQELVRWAVAERVDTLRNQIERVVPARTGDDSWWTAYTWSRTSHLDRRRYACGVVAGRLLILESGPLLEPEAPEAFDRLLRSITPAVR